MNNPDHYRFMPRPQGEEEHENKTEIPVISEENPGGEQEVEVISVSAKIPDAPAPEPEKEEEEKSFLGEEPYEGIAWMETVPVRCVYNILSPLVIPTVATWFIFTLSLLKVVVPGGEIPYSLTVFAATCVVPLIALYVLFRVGAVKSFQMYRRKERIVPYLLEILALGAVALFFVYKGANPWIWGIFCGATAAALVNFIINFWLRVSNHCSAIAGLLAVLLVIHKYGLPPVSLLWWVIGVVIATGIIGSMAIGSGRHSIWEVLAGYATGFLGVFLFSLIH